MSIRDFREHEPELMTPMDSAPAQTAPPPLAMHADPSQPAPGQGAVLAQATAVAQHAQVTWMRPTDLPTLAGRELLGRAVEVQTVLAHRNWRAPVRITEAVRGRLTDRQTPAPDVDLEPRPGVGARCVDALDGVDALVDGLEPEGVRLA